jgi:hypothetical protein
MSKDLPPAAKACPICGYPMMPELVQRPPVEGQLGHPGYYQRMTCLNSTCGYVLEPDRPSRKGADHDE